MITFQAHMMRLDQNDDIYIMTYRGSINEIRLPNMEYWLSNVDRLTILLETTCRHEILSCAEGTRAS